MSTYMDIASPEPAVRAVHVHVRESLLLQAHASWVLSLLENELLQPKSPKPSRQYVASSSSFFPGVIDLMTEKF
jgi:hypothetical protein